eukprot:TRINITY_DN5409_c0_g1_i2.p1 TRINITY_DN5409_c0_g1~~TRINITY_DN5409_c0_g1_i2.p1  ORF type:complete len:175 (-),score=54.07 TRINITY_DN5409_c0_g1_i2:12-536(-)
MTAVNPKRTIYIGGLDDSTTNELLRAAFIPFGDILQVNLPSDIDGGKHKGFGFVEFELAEDALAAVDNMHSSELLGKVITCSIAKPQAAPGAKGRAVWTDETNAAAVSAENGVVRESIVEQNAPKKARMVHTNHTIEKNTTPVPAGFVRCSVCGGWGKDLVKDNGKCNHCTRNS